MRTFILFLSLFACVSALYETQPSGYGSSNPSEVQKLAQRSPKNKPVDYSAISYNTKKTGSYKIRRNKSEVTENRQKLTATPEVRPREISKVALLSTGPIIR
ncbi:hypothetical protein OESDEN_19342 [Oesophagostomum dentatum]|uniref:Uncharacterized protein n=1 Tax=Oesophagostomum dentatum TaxID=61180 RepID=A0A0B1SBQ0_OESDE|nr:hypothetical protein OESDEN_19342 [Oesophagostomum dentatum]